jgi:DNA-binding MarR family transcriptional regulator
MRLSRLWDKEIKDFLGEHGLEPGEFDVLSTLRRSGEPYELPAKAFLKASLATTGAITLRVDRLVQSLDAGERSHLAAMLAGLLESQGDTPGR